MQKLGLKGFHMAVEKGWDKIPDAAFRADKTNPLNPFSDKKQTKDQDRDRGGDRNRDLDDNDYQERSSNHKHRSRHRRDSSYSDDSRRERRSHRHRSSREQPRNSQSEYSPSQEQQQLNQPSQQQQQQPQPQPQQYYPQPGPDNTQFSYGPQQQVYYPPPVQRAYQPQDQIFQPRRGSLAAAGHSQTQFQQPPQGDPSFTSQGHQLQQDSSQDYASPVSDQIFNTKSIDGSSRPPENKEIESPPMQNDQYYSHSAPRDPPEYNRYTPGQYTPQGYNSNAYQDERYVPAQYAPDQYQHHGSGSYGHDRSGAVEPYGAHADDRHASDERRKSHHRDRSTSSSREPGIRGMVHKHFDSSERGLGASALGAAAGGYLGHRIGKGTLSTVAGVLLGGVAANAWEAREERHKYKSRDSPAHAHRRSHSEGRQRSSRFYDDERSDERYERPFGGRSRGSSRHRSEYYDDERDRDRDRGRDRDYDRQPEYSDEEYDRKPSRSRSHRGERDYRDY